jgi:tRNA modification GTPase
MYPLDDTIAAIASPPGGAARGIVRLSGPQAMDCLVRLFQPDSGQLLAPQPSPYAVAGSLRLPGLHSPLPCDVYGWSERISSSCSSCSGACPPREEANSPRKPVRHTTVEHPRNATPHGNVHSYTGQPVVELHTVGSPPLLDIVLRSICAAGARLAEPGEFTLRAFLAGRIDLTQAEAVLGVIDAGDPHELEIALVQLAGGLARPLQSLRNRLLELLAHVEAGFDFADEDLPFITREELDRQLSEAAGETAAILRQVASRSELSRGLRAVLLGRPNTGKSSLFNALAGDHAALVSQHPGTTRDYLTAELDLDGVKCHLIDTAGIRGERREERGEGWAVHRPLGDSIDEAAASAAAQQRRGAHVQVLCLDSSRPLDAWERAELARVAERPRIVVLTKCDSPRQAIGPPAAVETSSLTGQGIAALRCELRQQALTAGEHGGDVVAGTAVRSADSLRLAGQCLQCARQAVTAGQDELVAAEMRAAVDELGKVVGAVYTEDVLDRIFSRFCIGK